MKTIAMYLPQFHRVKENDEWWGEGYTEWTAVKSAEPLFEGHNQPRVPLHHNYYDLLEKDTMKWQAKLARQYGIEGFCFYHYYFKDGKKILEKPVENFLKWQDIDMPFCFCWANDTWARTWSKVEDKASWGEKFENRVERTGNGVLLEQDYGNEAEWEKHFYYLLPFLKDKRYIRYQDRPVFLIYKPQKVYCLLRMVRLWKVLAKRENIPEIYVIGVNVGDKAPGLDARLMLEPGAHWNIDLTGKKAQRQKENGVDTYLYKDLLDAAGYIGREDSGKTYLSAVVDYDDTPRRGKNGYCLKGSDPALFEKKFTEILRESIRRENEFVFINAWNEWGEGMYLEPDENHGYGYLEAVAGSLQNIKEDRHNKIDIPYKNECDSQKEMRRELEHLRGHYELLHGWFQLKEQNRNTGEYLTRNHYDKIAIYGWGVFGKHLYKDLQDTPIKVSCIVDKNQTEPGVISVEEFLKKIGEISAVIVTPIYAYAEIYYELSDKIDIPIISLEEVVMSLL